MPPPLRSIRTAALLALAMLAGSAFAEVFKCPGPDGRVLYSDRACDGGRSVNTQGNSVAAGVQTANRNDAQHAPAPPSPASPPAARCLTEQEIRNMKTSASSISVRGDDAIVQAEQIRRAEACQPQLTDAEVLLMKEELRARRRASRPAAQAPAAGGPKPCWRQGAAVSCP